MPCLVGLKWCAKSCQPNSHENICTKKKRVWHTWVWWITVKLPTVQLTNTNSPNRVETSVSWSSIQYNLLDPGENLSRIFKDLTRSSWGPLRILLRIFMRIFKILVKIFKDPSFSCQDLQGSLIFLPRSSRIFDFLAKIFEDLWLSCQDL